MQVKWPGYRSKLSLTKQSKPTGPSEVNRRECMEVRLGAASEMGWQGQVINRPVSHSEEFYFCFHQKPQEARK